MTNVRNRSFVDTITLKVLEGVLKLKFSETAVFKYFNNDAS